MEKTKQHFWSGFLGHKAGIGMILIILLALSSQTVLATLYIDYASATVFTTPSPAPPESGYTQYVDSVIGLPQGYVAYTMVEYNNTTSVYNSRMYVVSSDRSGTKLWGTDIGPQFSANQPVDASDWYTLLRLKGGKLVVMRSTACGKNLTFMLMNEDGTTATANPIRVNSSTGATYYCYYDMAALSNGNFVVVFQVNADEYFMRIFDPSGTPLQANEVSVDKTGTRDGTCTSQYTHHVRASKGGTFFVVYDCYMTSNNSAGPYYGVLYNNDGTQLTVGGFNHFKISNIAKGGSAQALLERLSDGNYLVEYKGEPVVGDYTSRDIRYRIVTPAGVLGTEVIRRVIGNSSLDPLVSLADGGFLLGTYDGSSNLLFDRFTNSGTQIETGSKAGDPAGMYAIIYDGTFGGVGYFNDNTNQIRQYNIPTSPAAVELVGMRGISKAADSLGWMLAIAAVLAAGGVWVALRRKRIEH